MRPLIPLAALAVVAVVVGAVPAPRATQQQAGGFDHAKHTPLFPSCAACHTGIGAGDPYPDPSFCTTCHDGRTQPPVDWAQPPARSEANLKFQHAAHPVGDQCTTCHVADGSVQRAVVGQCLECHGAGESHFEAPDCAVCHVQPPAPASHAAGWRDTHGSDAAARPETCATCHDRTDCLDCHRPGAASPGGGYHSDDFLARHPVAAYSQETQCADCHNVGQFCQSCHEQAGLVSQQRPLGAGYHDAKRSFVAGHGQAARQNLASCVACHTERDCVRCHVNTSPHGAGFEPEGQANREVCIVCHRQGVPGGQ